MSNERWTDERLDRLASLVEKNTQAQERHDRNFERIEHNLERIEHLVTRKAATGSTKATSTLFRFRICPRNIQLLWPRGRNRHIGRFLM